MNFSALPPVPDPKPIAFEIDGSEYERIADEMSPKTAKRALRLQFLRNAFQIVLGIVAAASLHRDIFLVSFGVAYAALAIATGILNVYNFRRMRFARPEGVVRVTFDRNGLRIGEDARGLVRWPSVRSVESRREAIVVMGRTAPIVVIPKRALSHVDDVWQYFEAHLIGRAMLRRPRAYDRIVNTAAHSKKTFTA